MTLSIVFLILGLCLTVVGADYFVSSSTLIAKRFKIPSLIIGLTIVAIGTSAPEFGVNITSSIGGYGSLALGNVLGSNISNILLIFAVASLFAKRIHISRNSLTQISLVTILSLTIALLALFTPRSLSPIEGVLLLVAGLFYWMYLYKITREDKERLEDEDIVHNPLSRIAWFGWIPVITIASLAGLLVGSSLVTAHAVAIAQFFGIPELIIGGTIIAIGTSLPELVTSIQAARQKQYDLMIGNIAGSNIVNTLFVLGTSMVINKIPIDGGAPTYLYANVGASILLLIGFTISKERTFPRYAGVIFIALYIVFLFVTLR